MPLSRYRGVFEPADLELLQRVFDRLCKERRLALKNKVQRLELAAEIVAAFKHGIDDEAQLLQAVSKRRKKN